jgi:hypothetical protein
MDYKDYDFLQRDVGMILISSNSFFINAQFRKKWSFGKKIEIDLTIAQQPKLSWTFMLSLAGQCPAAVASWQCVSKISNNLAEYHQNFPVVTSTARIITQWSFAKPLFVAGQNNDTLGVIMFCILRGEIGRYYVEDYLCIGCAYSKIIWSKFPQMLEALWRVLRWQPTSIKHEL